MAILVQFIDVAPGSLEAEAMDQAIQRDIKGERLRIAPLGVDRHAIPPRFTTFFRCAAARYPGLSRRPQRRQGSALPPASRLRP
jgi:hypothetical protein